MMNLENQGTHMESPRVLTQTARLLVANGLIWSALWSPVFFVTAISPLPVHAQQTEGTGRKLLYKVEPQYPVILKANRIGGVVRMNVSISPGGAVQSVLPLGGSPPLMDAAVTAVKKWKYEPAFGWTNIEVRLRFIP
jgi:TonB family protein